MESKITNGIHKTAHNRNQAARWNDTQRIDWARALACEELWCAAQTHKRYAVTFTWHFLVPTYALMIAFYHNILKSLFFVLFFAFLSSSDVFFFVGVGMIAVVVSIFLLFNERKWWWCFLFTKRNKIVPSHDEVRQHLNYDEFFGFFFFLRSLRFYSGQQNSLGNTHPKRRQKDE